MNFTFSLLGNFGRLGNQLFQVAAMIGFSKKYNAELKFPEWKYAEYFDNTFPVGSGDEITGRLIQETSFKYVQDYPIIEDDNCDFKGYFQSEKY